ncbi:MAG: class I SAM-dependent methyltransferase, partial [Pseudomonadales bacterium]|nr:class I SAM-dependent methyltransferase [Pseudomonadales bacterium]
KRLITSMLKKIKHGQLTIREKNTETFLLVSGKISTTGLSAEIIINSPQTWRLITQRGALGAAEAYMHGFWDTPDLFTLLRLVAKNRETMQKIKNLSSILNKVLLFTYNRFRKNSVSGSSKNIRAHYDLGNDFFRLFLDESMMYSSAIFPNPYCSLEHASEFKLQQICKALNLQPGDHILEIGTGWGGFALYAARHHQVHITTTTLSKEQFALTQQKVKEAGLEKTITVLLKDYRHLDGKYDKVVSIEMIEAVGHQYINNYFSKISSLLKEDGLACIQAITINHDRYHAYKDSSDFIQHYIFPGGCLPTIKTMTDGITQYAGMEIINNIDIGLDYARTLFHWRQRFELSLNEMRNQGFSEEFIRMWRYYLCYCEAGFVERTISTVQLSFAKPGFRFNSEYNNM